VAQAKATHRSVWMFQMWIVPSHAGMRTVWPSGEDYGLRSDVGLAREEAAEQFTGAGVPECDSAVVAAGDDRGAVGGIPDRDGGSLVAGGGGVLHPGVGQAQELQFAAVTGDRDLVTARRNRHRGSVDVGGSPTQHLPAGQVDDGEPVDR
jgi:hypothetical protein